MTRPSLDDLLEKLCQGDLEAAEQVFVAYEPYLRQVVRRQISARLRTRFDSVDIVQSAWRDLLHGFSRANWSFATTAQLQAFLVKATRNRFIDRYRQHSATLSREEPLGEIDVHKLPAALDPLPGEIMQAEDLWHAMLSNCPQEYHELLHLKRDGASLAEIAELTNLHIGSVRRILRSLAVQMVKHRLP